MLMDNILGAAVSGWDGKDQHTGQPNGMAQICAITGFFSGA